MDSPSAPKPPRAKLFWPVWLAILALAIGSFFYFSKAFSSAIASTVFHQTPRGWDELPKLSSLPTEMRVSPAGVVWLQTFRGISRLERGAWLRQPTPAR